MKTTRIVRNMVFARHPGLDAAAAVLLAKCASLFDASIALSCGPHTANAKSLMGLLTLSVKPGDAVTVLIEGEDAAAAMEAVMALFHSSFTHLEVSPKPAAANRVPSEVERHAAHVA